MFAPTKTWRKWHRRINVNQKRYAMCSALAGSALPSLVMARGHRIEKISEVPLVVSNGMESIQKTSSAVKMMKAINAYDDVERCKNSKKIRAGKVRFLSYFLFPFSHFLPSSVFLPSECQNSRRNISRNPRVCNRFGNNDTDL